MFARTDRLLLRPGWADDAPALARAIADESITRNLAGSCWPATVDEAARFLAPAGDPRHPVLLVLLRTQGAPRLVGGVALTPAADGGADLCYWIARSFWGLGFATEAGCAAVALAHGSLRHPRLIADSAPDNPASGRVLRKLGFRAANDPLFAWQEDRGDAAPRRFERGAADPLVMRNRTLLAA